MLSFLRLLGAFLLNAIKRNQAPPIKRNQARLLREARRSTDTAPFCDVARDVGARHVRHMAERHNTSGPPPPRSAQTTGPERTAWRCALPSLVQIGAQRL